MIVAASHIRSVSHDQMVNAEPPAKSDRKSDYRAFTRPDSARPDVLARKMIERLECRAYCSALIGIAFPGPSIEAIAEKAAGPLLTKKRTIRRIIDGTTSRVDGGVLARAQAYCVMNGHDPLAIARRMMK